MMSTPAASSARLLVEDRRELPRQLLAALVVRVVERVDHRHRAGQRPLDRTIGALAQEPRVVDEHGALAAHLADDRRHARVVTVADAHGLALAKSTPLRCSMNVVTKC
jgi:hypothetical protein